MNIRIIPAALAFSAFAFAAVAQTGGSMSAPTTGGNMAHMAAPAGCPGAQNHMAGNHMAGGSMSGGDHMATGDHMAAGDHMASGNHMAAGDHMASGNKMAADTTGCPK